MIERIVIMEISVIIEIVVEKIERNNHYNNRNSSNYRKQVWGFY